MSEYAYATRDVGGAEGPNNQRLRQPSSHASKNSETSERAMRTSERPSGWFRLRFSSGMSPSTLARRELEVAAVWAIERASSDWSTQ